MILFKNIMSLVQDADTVQHSIDLLVDGNIIVQIAKDISPDGVDEIIECSDKIVAPGFINLHTHLYQNLLKGWGDKLTLKRWCEEVTFPFSSIIHADEKNGDHRLGYTYAALGALEQLHSGITTFVDMDILSDSVFQAWQDLGVRGIGAIQAVNQWVPEQLMVPDEVRKEKILQTVEKWDHNGLIRVAIAPSTPFACSKEFLLWLRDLAVSRNLNLFVHVSETRIEVEESIRSTGMSPLEYLHSIDFLEYPMSAVHAIHFTEEEHEIAKEHNVSICYNPKSNGKLGSGFAPIVDYDRMGLDVAVCTDGAASNDLLDIFEDMRFGLMLQKLRYEDPAVMTASDIYRMATETPAKIIGMNAGTLFPEKLADIIILDPYNAHFGPLRDTVQQIVYCGKAQDVCDVVVNGQFVMRDHKVLIIDETEFVKQGYELTLEKQSTLTGEALEAKF